MRLAINPKRIEAILAAHVDKPEPERSLAIAREVEALVRSPQAKSPLWQSMMIEASMRAAEEYFTERGEPLSATERAVKVAEITGFVGTSGDPENVARVIRRHVARAKREIARRDRAGQK